MWNWGARCFQVLLVTDSGFSGNFSANMVVLLFSFSLKLTCLFSEEPMKRILIIAVAALICVLTGWRILHAEELNAIFGRVNEYVKASNYPKALDELSWARKEIEKLHTAKLQTFLPDELAGFTGQKVEANTMLGLSNIQRRYTKGSLNVTVSITGAGGGGAASGLGGLAAFGRMAAMMGGEAGQETFRINGRTATLAVSEKGGGSELTVFLDSGSFLKIEMSKGKDAEALKAMAGAMDLDGLDKYLRG